MKIVLLGDPVEHSRSPAIHNAAFAALGIAGDYTARRVDAAQTRIAVDEIRYGRLDGANVTMPHKELAFDLSDRVAEDALRAGAVNTLVRSSGEVWGHNTDAAGMRAILKEPGWQESAPVLVLGTGGAAAGALVAVAGRNVSIAGRRNEAAADLLTRTRVDGTVVAWGAGVDGAIVVNATPLGMRGEALPDEILSVASGLLDLTYGSGPSPAVERARSLGIPVADGRDMLLAQAAVSFEIWTGLAAPVDVMRSAF
ncbi:MAG TPA: shikimate dehydrogenase [Acidimicrobiia bacterium]|nr:shikimate dehydrogenase [Acidimicrobiia bacterium]